MVNRETFCYLRQDVENAGVCGGEVNILKNMTFLGYET